MDPIPNRFKVAGFGLLAVGLLMVNCAGPQPPVTATGPVYETVTQIKSMPRCKARVVELAPCYVTLQAASGSTFFIGSPAAGQDVVQFLGNLKEGKTYRFPDEFLAFEAKHPTSRD